MISRFFIERPRTSAVLSIIIILAGILSLQVLPVKEYPTLTPPQITVTAVYAGADADTLSKTVSAPLKEAINGVENMLYMTSIASSSGILNMSIFFEVGTDPNIAKMDVNNRVQTALSRLLSEKAASDFLKISVASTVVTTYFNLLSTERQIKTATEIMNRLRDIYEFRQKQFNRGLVDQIVVLQSRSKYESTRILIEVLKGEKEVLRSSLSVLLGMSPKEIFERDDELKAELPEPLPLPEILPSDILHRRPDIIQAEENLKASNFEIGVARALYFPAISLTAQGGLHSNELGELIQSSATFWNLGARVTGTLIDFGRIKGNILLKEAQKKEALLRYIKTVRLAFKEVYDAITGLGHARKRLEAQQDELQTLERLKSLVEEKYNRGLIDYLSVLDAQRRYLHSRLDVIRLKTELLNSYVYFYRAVGGL